MFALFGTGFLTGVMYVCNGDHSPIQHMNTVMIVYLY